MTIDLTGWSTLALAVVTAALAATALAQILLSQRGDKLRLEFELFRLTQSQAPIVVAEIKFDGMVFNMIFRNVGTGPAINIRFSGLINHGEFSAAQLGIPAIGAGADRVAIERQGGSGITEFLIRYEDVFGNIYSTEYQQLTAESAWYVWRRPHLARGLFPRPAVCSEDYPAWDFKGRIYYDAAHGLW